MPKQTPNQKPYWCSNCHLEFKGEPPIRWLKDLYDYYNFCTKKCSEAFSKKMTNGNRW